MSGHILNPKTQRPIKVGGKVWRKLVNEGILERQAQEHELHQAETKEEAKVAVKILKKNNKDRNHSIKLARNGKTVIKAKKRLSQKQISQDMSKASTRVISRIGRGEIELPEDMDTTEFIQSEILKELMKCNLKHAENLQPVNYRPRNLQEPRRKPLSGISHTRRQKKSYVLEEPLSESETESSESSESEVDI